MPDAGRDLFERLKAEQWALVDAWLAEKEAETLHLEFKLKANAATATIDDEDKAEIAKTLSAFANTEGGLLVVGIDAGGGNGKGFDRVTRVDRLADVERFGGALERRIRTFTDPPIAALMLIPIKKPEAGTSGVLGVHVPPSDGGPHRVANASSETNDRYYMRTAAGAQTIPHSLLAALFSRTATPKLSLEIRLVGGRNVQVEFRLFNRGRGVARRPAIMFAEWPGSTLQPDFLSLQENGFFWRPNPGNTDLARVLIEPREDLVIYPGTDRILMTAKPVAECRIVFRASLYAVDAQPRGGDGILAITAAGANDGPPLVIPAEDEGG